MTVLDEESEAGKDESVCYLIGIETPELEFFFEERTTHIGWIMKLACSIIVEYLSKDSRMSVKEIFIE